MRPHAHAAIQTATRIAIVQARRRKLKDEEGK